MISAFEPTTVLIFPPEGAVCVAHGLDLTSFSGQATSPHKEIIVNQICLSVFFFFLVCSHFAVQPVLLSASLSPAKHVWHLNDGTSVLFSLCDLFLVFFCVDILGFPHSGHDLQKTIRG